MREEEIKARPSAVSILICLFVCCIRLVINVVNLSFLNNSLELPSVDILCGIDLLSFVLLVHFKLLFLLFLLYLSPATLVTNFAKLERNPACVYLVDLLLVNFHLGARSLLFEKNRLLQLLLLGVPLPQLLLVALH